MDAVAYSLASKQAQRIEKFIANPDSASGIVTVPKKIEAGETVTVPAGRVAVLPNVQVDGELVVEGDGEIFVPSGATLVTTDTVAWKTQTFPDWISDKGDGLPFAYAKNAIVRGSDGENYVSLEDNNEDNPISSAKWINLSEYGKDKEIALTGTATFDGTTQKITMTNIGNITLAIGDVIEVTGTTSNNKLFTVESIMDNNNIVVNYEHRGTSTPIPKGRLINETASNCTVRLYNRAKNAPLGQGQYWCVPASARAVNQNYTNNTMREIIYYVENGSTGTIFTLNVDNIICSRGANVNGTLVPMQATVPPGSIYSQNGGVKNYWAELR